MPYRVLLLILATTLASTACEEPADKPAPAAEAKPAAEVEDKATPAPKCDPVETARKKVGVGDEVARGAVDVQSNDGVFSATVEAGVGGPAHMQGAPWTYVDLDKGEKVALGNTAAFDDARWDIAFKNSLIRLNGGDSGPGHWQMYPVQTGFEAIHAMAKPDAKWRDDDFVADDCALDTYGPGFPMTAFGRWYDYEPESHKVSAPNNAVYVLRDAGTAKKVAFEIQSYDKGVYTLRWREI